MSEQLNDIAFVTGDDFTVNVPPQKGVLTLSDNSGPVVEIEVTTPFVLRHPRVTLDGKEYIVTRKVSFEWRPVEVGN